MPLRRTTDRVNTPLFLVGVLIILSAVGGKIYLAASDTLVIALVLIGGSMIPGNHIVDLVRSWRSRNDNASKSQP